MTTDMVQLCDIATVIAGQSPPGHTYNEHGSGLPFFQGKADFGELYPVARKWCIAPRKIAEAGDILVSVRAPVGPTNVARERCCIGRGLAAVRADEAFVLRDFVHWNIKHRQSELISKGQGSTFAAIKQKDLKSLPIHLPPLDEQRRIVGILNRAAKIERLQKQAQERLREFIPALFIKMFGDPVENPMKWPKQKLGEICLKTEQYNPGKHPTQEFQYVDISGIDNVSKKINRFRLILGAEAPSRARKRIRTSDVLVSSVRPNLNAVAIVPDHLDGGIASTGFCVLRANRKILDPTYLFLQVCSTYFINTMISKARGANYPAVSDKDVRDTLIPLPPLHIQNCFADIVKEMQVSMTHIDRSGQIATSLGTSLMTFFLGGDI